MPKPSSAWPGISCESDAWPFTADYFVFEARRAVGQGVRTTTSEVRNDRNFNDGDLVLFYLNSANQLSRAIKELTRDLVAEARSRGRTWTQIGVALGYAKDTAVQKRFGSSPDPGRMSRLAEDTDAVNITREIIEGPYEGIEDFSDAWQGVSHVARLKYAIKLLGDTREKLNRALWATYEMCLTKNL
jgi:hypothetical protein